MIGVIGGLVAAVLWGTSTVVASRSTRMIGSQQALGYVMLTGLVLMVVAAPLFEEYPAVLPIQDLRCRLAKARKFFPPVIEAHCARLAALCSLSSYESQKENANGNSGRTYNGEDILTT